jgi:hypothetical protein
MSDYLDKITNGSEADIDNGPVEARRGDESKISAAESSFAEDADERNKKLTVAMHKKARRKDAIARTFRGILLFFVVTAVGLVAVSHFGDKKTIERQAALLHKKVAEVNDLETEVTSLTNRIESIKTKDDMAKRDLEAYISKKHPTVSKVLAREIAAQTARLSKKYNVPFPLIVGIEEVESGFKPWAVSKAGARGLMQVMPAWVKKGKDGRNKLNMDIDKNDLYDVEPNLTAGIKVFKIHLAEANNNINQALYYYVGRDRKYAGAVFNAMGRFVTFRSTLDTSLTDDEDERESEKPPVHKNPTQQGYR